MTPYEFGRRAATRVKTGALLPGVELQPAQQRIADAGHDYEARKLIYHGLGSGKTLASIAHAETVGSPYTAVGPAALRTNFQKEREKWTDQQTPASVYSFNALSQGNGPDETDTLIVDEAQNLRNANSQRTKAVQDLADTAKHVLLLSGTPIVNHPHDLAPLISMLTQQTITPEQFDKRYVGHENVSPGLFGWLKGVKPGQRPVLQNADELKDLLAGHVDYRPSPEMGIDKIDEDYTVPMSAEQTSLYQGFWDRLPWLLRWKVQNDFPLSNREMQNLSAFLSGPRQVSLSTLPFMRGRKEPYKAFQQSPKLQKALELATQQLQGNPNARGVAFSNFIDAGLTPYQAALERAGIPSGVFHGGLTDAQRKAVVDDYNKGKLRMLLLGPSGGEGISLKGTRLLQILDPHWNEARTSQAIGRGIRFDSHNDLPEDERNITVQRFESELPPDFLSRLWRKLVQTKPDNEKNAPGSDAYLRQLAKRKTELNEQFLHLLQEVGSEQEA